MFIKYHAENEVFHLSNNKISYVFHVLENGHLGHIYYGKTLQDHGEFDQMVKHRCTVLAPCTFKDNMDFSLETSRLEYPSYGTGDYRDPAFDIVLDNGSTISDFKYVRYEIFKGKKGIEGLPATFGDNIFSLEVVLQDDVSQLEMILSYSIFENYGAIAKSVKVVNNSNDEVKVNRLLSTSMDLYDCDYDMIQLDGSWSRERHIHRHPIHCGIQSIGSTRGSSSAMHNPFLTLARKETTEASGEAYGVTLLYSGNFIGQVQVDNYDVTRVMMGIHPFEFGYVLEPGDSFSTPEAIVVYSDEGLNKMSQTFHDVFRNHLMRGPHAKQTRPILINNWEATYFDFDHDRIMTIATKAKELGVELFVLDDGWFGKREDDHTSLGDWFVNLQKLPQGIKGLSKEIHDLGLQFGLWFEPEMVNEVSELYKSHPEWVIATPGRNKTYGRNQFVLDFSNKDVVDYIFTMIKETLDDSDVDYIKWDMNRNITEAYSSNLPANKQKEFFHRYILGVYDLYERLIQAFPNILFESCASGGNRFDAGMLYYAPQAWTSDDTDAIERLMIQTGTSMAYPIVSMGSHVSAVPNHQVARMTSLKMRGDVAYFGTFGYELDVNKMTVDEQLEVKEQIKFFKDHRALIHFGDFYRLEKGENGFYSWLIVSKDQKQAILGCFKILGVPNPGFKKVKLQGLNPAFVYTCDKTERSYYGDELLQFGMPHAVGFSGIIQGESYKGVYNPGTDLGDYTSNIYVFKAK